MAVGGPTRHDLWRQYQIHVDLYRHYLELTLKLNIFFYAVAGAIASFCLSRPFPAGPIRYALLLPALLAIGLAAVCFYGARLNSYTRAELIRVTGALGLTTSPEVRVLSVVLCISGVLFVIAAIALAGVIFFPHVLGPLNWDPAL
jgi:hypothetical protein